MDNLYTGTEKRCPICGGKIKHPYIGLITSEQIEKDFESCLWIEVTDESRSCLGYRPICRKEHIKKN